MIALVADVGSVAADQFNLHHEYTCDDGRNHSSDVSRVSEALTRFRGGM